MIEIPKRDYMIDIETMSLRSTAAIVAIGAVEIVDNVVTGNTYETRISLEDAMRHGLHVDGGTVEWWMQQTDAARRVFAQPAQMLDDTLEYFRLWMFETGPGLVWGNGAAFDLAILKSAYHALYLQCPWNYKQERCYRTVKELFHTVCPEPDDDEQEGKHNALWDAVFQANHLCAVRRHVTMIGDQFTARL